MPSDPVHQPDHYKQYAIETIDAIRMLLTNEEFIGYCKGNMLKYRLRAGHKDDRDIDLAKSNVYQDWISKP